MDDENEDDRLIIDFVRKNEVIYNIKHNDYRNTQLKTRLFMEFGKSINKDKTMVDTARQLLDELMGRNRNLDPSTAKCKKVNWDDPEFCLYFLVKFCPHDLFVNTRADLGQCQKLHDEEAKRLYEEARPTLRKRNYEDEFLRFSNHMINEVDRKISKGKQRLLLMNKGETAAPVPFISKYQEQLNNLNARIKKLIGEAEEAGNRGDVDQAQGLMSLCDQLKDEKENAIKQHELGLAVGNVPPGSSADETSPGRQQQQKQTSGGSGNGSSSQGSGAAGSGNNQSQPHVVPWTEYVPNEKQMEVCEVCGAFLIVGDAQQRIEDHLTGKQHIGYSRLRKAVEEMYEKRRMEREEEDRMRDEERRNRYDNGMRDRRRRSRDRFDDRRYRGIDERRNGDDRRDNRGERREHFRGIDRRGGDMKDNRYRGGRSDRGDYKRRSRSRSRSDH